MATSINLSSLQKEAEKLGIALNREESDNTYWGQVLSTRMELGGYATATAALEDLKAVQQLDSQQDIFEYDNDPDDESLYRVTYKPDGMIFTDAALAVAFTDALQHHTEKTAPAPAPAPAKRSRMRKPGNGPSVEETLPDTKGPVEAIPEANQQKQEKIAKGLIRSEEPGPTREMPSITPQQQISSALLALAHSITEIANNLGSEANLTYGSAFEEPKDVAPKPSRNRRSSN